MGVKTMSQQKTETLTKFYVNFGWNGDDLMSLVSSEMFEHIKPLKHKLRACKPHAYYFVEAEATKRQLKGLHRIAEALGCLILYNESDIFY
jgi:hypothetical protein